MEFNDFRLSLLVFVNGTEQCVIMQSAEVYKN